MSKPARSHLLTPWTLLLHENLLFPNFHNTLGCKCEEQHLVSASIADTWKKHLFFPIHILTMADGLRIRELFRLEKTFRITEFSHEYE